jgi:copper(I)-binding protein
MINKISLFLITSFINLSLVYAGVLAGNSAQNTLVNNTDSIAPKNADAADSNVVATDAAVLLNITNVRARAVNTKNSALYFVVQNKSNQDIVILGASCPEIANKVEIHDVIAKANGAMEMKKLDKLLVPVNSTIELKPRALHIMLMDLKKELKDGDKCSCILSTDKGDQKLEIDIKKNID